MWGGESGFKSRIISQLYNEGLPERAGLYFSLRATKKSSMVGEKRLLQLAPYAFFVKHISRKQAQYEIHIICFQRSVHEELSGD